MNRRARSLASLALAVALHALGLFALLKLPERVAEIEPSRVTFELVRPPAPLPGEKPAVRPPLPRLKPPPPAAEPPKPSPRDVEPPPTSKPPPALESAEPTDPAEPEPAALASDSEDELRGLRRPERGSLLERVLEEGMPGELAADLSTLEGALDHKAPGPMSDKERAERELNGFFRGTLAAQDVRRGMAHDWFRDVGKTIRRSWRPHARELNDPSEATHLVILGRFVTNPKEWAEYGPLYVQDVLGLLARDRARDPTLAFTPNPSAPTLSGQVEPDDAERLERLRKLLAENTQALRYIARARVVVHHHPDGSVDSIEIVNPSGHDRLDEGMVEAVERALLAVGAELPPSDGGAPPTSHWLLSAVWQVTPLRCASITTDDGAGPHELRTTSTSCGIQFDVTPDGAEAEVPLVQLKVKTDVELLEVER